MAYKIVDSKKKKGRLKKADYEGIDRQEVKKLAGMMCTNPEIASFFDVSEDTIERHFAGELAGWRHFGHCSLRRSQWIKALEGHSGDTVMLKHLGRCYLGQGDEPQDKSQQPYFKAFVEDINKHASKPLPE
jgi:hypothetical protein